MSVTVPYNKYLECVQFCVVFYLLSIALDVVNNSSFVVGVVVVSAAASAAAAVE